MLGRKCIKIGIILLMLLVVIGGQYVYAIAGGPQKVEGSTTVDVSNIKLVKTAKNLWTTAAVIIQIIAVAAIVFTGLRYMFASADVKADIKTQTIILVIGAILVFCAVEVADLVYNAATDILPDS